MTIDREAMDRTTGNLVRRLCELRTPGGWWEGNLASSALATATAVSALRLAGDTNFDKGLAWLAANQNMDGGWGDTILSRSNISTTLLCWSAFSITGSAQRYAAVNDRAESWLRREAGSLESVRLVEAILRRYGNDRTFSVPILTVMTIAGKLGKGRNAWREVPQLPFELAALPHQLFGWLRLPVVSYALPALIAIGQVRHHHRPSRNAVLRSIRNLVGPDTLHLLREIQPSTGGYLEATPLTSFVVMSLASAGMIDHPVVAEGARFLRVSMRADGSWPIDTNLATWLTTLSVNVLAGLGESDHPLDRRSRRALRDWLLGQQYRQEHPYTHAAPGGWAWTPLPGGVPDADDTAGALLALRNLGETDGEVRTAAWNGIHWLLGLRNSDGGMPTFCRGWGKLPFDRSGADLTGHALAAWQAWLPEMEVAQHPAIRRGIAGAQSYLQRMQNPDGSWTPLWFGNEHASGEENRTYGTARVLITAAGSGSPMFARARGWLAKIQNPDGGWGGAPGTPSSVEETSLALHALSLSASADARPSVLRGVQWLMERTECGTRIPVAPIGLYFAKLWYYEELYPVIFATGALIAARAALDNG